MYMLCKLYRITCMLLYNARPLLYVAYAVHRSFAFNPDGWQYCIYLPFFSAFHEDKYICRREWRFGRQLVESIIANGRLASAKPSKVSQTSISARAYNQSCTERANDVFVRHPSPPPPPPPPPPPLPTHPHLVYIVLYGQQRWQRRSKIIIVRAPLKRTLPA